LGKVARPGSKAGNVSVAPKHVTIEQIDERRVPEAAVMGGELGGALSRSSIVVEFRMKGPLQFRHLANQRHHERFQLGARQARQIGGR
jgi:hypothetical protein